MHRSACQACCVLNSCTAIIPKQPVRLQHSIDITGLPAHFDHCLLSGSTYSGNGPLPLAIFELLQCICYEVKQLSMQPGQGHVNLRTKISMTRRTTDILSALLSTLSIVGT